MLYSIMDLMCDKIIQMLKIDSPDQTADETFQNTEFHCLKTDVDRRCGGWTHKHEASLLRPCMWKLGRELRNKVEHRHLLTAKESRSMALDAASVMLILGDSETAWRVLAIWQHFDSSMKTADPLQWLSWQHILWRAMAYLDGWENPSYPAGRQSGSLNLLVRKHHPFLYCLRPVLQNLERKVDGRLNARWYQKISAGTIELREARTPTTDYWNGKPEDESGLTSDGALRMQPLALGIECAT